MRMSKQEKKELVPKLRFPEFRDASGWEENTFGGAATFLNGRAYKQDELLDKGKYRVLRVGNFFSNNHWYYSDLELEEDKYCEKGDLLYAWSASFGPRIWRGEKVIYHYHIWKVLEKNGVDRNFLFILLGYETERMKSQSANGLGLMHITKGAIESWKCRIPEIEEQQKIADCLTSVDELITAQTQKLAALKTHKKGLMQQLFPAEGETVPKLRFPEFRDKGGWDVEELGGKTIKIGSGITPSGGDKNYKVEGRPFVRSQNVGWGCLILDDVAYLDEETHSSFSATEIQKDDVLLNITGASIGRSAVASSKIEGGNVNQHVCIIRTKKNELTPFFLNQFLISQAGQSQIDCFQTGGNRQGLNFAQIRSLTIPMPLKIEEQQKIADCLSAIDDLITVQTQKLDALKAHKKGLMQQLFPVMDKMDA
jgi:type I restriction enzyme S subunit